MFFLETDYTSPSAGTGWVHDSRNQHPQPKLAIVRVCVRTSDR